MITEQDLQEAILECQGERNPNANTCIKLAAFYTIRKELFGEKETPQYSYAPAPVEAPTIQIDSDTEFARAIEGKDAAQVWRIIDELMSTLDAMNPRLYNAVLREIDEL